MSKSNWNRGRKEVREYLRLKFLPMTLRPRLWKAYLSNPSGITKKTYSIYRDILAKQKSKSGGVFGSQQIIVSAVNETLKQMKIKVTPEVYDSIVRILQVFEYQHPDVGYFCGMEKPVFVLRSLVGVEEERCYVIFYNLYFASDLLWAVITCDHAAISNHMKALEGLVGEFSTCKAMYAVNRLHFERFFIEAAACVFVGVLPPDLVEKLLDYLTVVDDTVMLMVMLCIVKSFGNFDMSFLKYEAAREFILKCVRLIPDAVIVQHILMTSANYKEVKEFILKVMKEDREKNK